MHTSTFFKLFPPPKFLLMRHAGLEISDDSIHCLEFSYTARGPRVSKFAGVDMPAGTIENGDIKDEKALAGALTDFEKKNGLSYVKVSVPEEKAYLFQTDVPDSDFEAIEQNIESKLEQNVPLSAQDAVFYFDLMPLSVTGGALRASVSVVPRAYIEHLSSLLNAVGMYPVAYEMVAKSIARAVVPGHSDETCMIIHIMDKKTGIDIAAAGVVCFTSTVGSGSGAPDPKSGDAYIQALSKEINRVYGYWTSHESVHSPVSRIILVGKNASLYESKLQNVIVGAHIPVRIADVWQNVIDVDTYIPPVSKEMSLDFAVAIGLAIES